jgi:hypothetical protein
MKSFLNPAYKAGAVAAEPQEHCVTGGLGWSLTNYFLHVRQASTTIEYKAK